MVQNCWIGNCDKLPCKELNLIMTIPVNYLERDGKSKITYNFNGGFIELALKMINGVNLIKF